MSALLSPAVFALYFYACGERFPVVHEAPAERALAHAMAESGLYPNALHDNTTGKRYAPATETEAVALARQLIAAGHRLDAGLMQVTSANWAAYGLTVETAFDPQANVCAGARILGVAFETQRRAACVYNTGHPDCANGYPESVDKAARHVADETPAQPPAPASEPPCAPAWDGWALAACTTQQKGQLR